MATIGFSTYRRTLFSLATDTLTTANFSAGTAYADPWWIDTSAAIGKLADLVAFPASRTHAPVITLLATATDDRVIRCHVFGRLRWIF